MSKIPYIGHSKAIHELKGIAETFSQLNKPLLITGEFGSGKTHFARLLHYYSKLNESKIRIIIGGLEKEEERLVKSAIQRNYELIQKPKNDVIDTIIIKDANSLSMISQKLITEFLNYLSTKGNPYNIFFTSNFNIKVLQESLNPELFYILSNYEIRIPPLREHKEDIPLLIDYFSKQLTNSIVKIPENVLSILLQYDWPGNISELRNTIEYSLVKIKDNKGTLSKELLPEPLQNLSTKKSNIRNGSCLFTKSFEELVDNFEFDLLIKALEVANGNIAKAARLLKLTERKIGYKINKHKIEPKKFQTR